MPKKEKEKKEGEEEDAEEDGIELAEEAKEDAIECPICLAPGFERNCCGAFYCKHFFLEKRYIYGIVPISNNKSGIFLHIFSGNDDYFRTGRCPNCDTPCVKRGFDFKVYQRECVCVLSVFPSLTSCSSTLIYFL